jgi:hypothetical protein
LFNGGGEVREVIAISGSKAQVDNVDPLSQTPIDCAKNDGERCRETRVEDFD